MALQIPTGFSQVGLLITNSNTTHTSEVTFGCNWPGNTHTFEELGTAVYAFALDLLQDMSADLTCSDVVVTGESPGGGTGSVTVPLPDPIAGGVSGDPMTPNVSYLYRKNTAILGRKYRGRMYLPGVVESKVDGGGNVDGDFLFDQRNHATSALEAFNTAFLTEPFVMVLLHSDPDIDPTPVTDLVPEARVATQRRRLPRV